MMNIPFSLEQEFTVNFKNNTTLYFKDFPVVLPIYSLLFDILILLHWTPSKCQTNGVLLDIDLAGGFRSKTTPQLEAAGQGG